MSNAAAMVSSLLTDQELKAHYTEMLLYYTGKLEANQAKLSKQVKYEEKWESAFDDAIDNSSEVKARGFVVNANNQDRMIADTYAHLKVEAYNEELSLELAEMDVQYDTMKTMYEALSQQVDATIQSKKAEAGKATQDTGLLQS